MNDVVQQVCQYLLYTLQQAAAKHKGSSRKADLVLALDLRVQLKRVSVLGVQLLQH